jgi:AraC family transcriptional regulator, regulatory protein of adaptative response / methylated-DNA-[protein]-cysteine methyltransferase
MELARWISPLASARAVAGACAANQIALAIPCHRVVRSDGVLADYRWGIERKRELIRKEAMASSEQDEMREIIRLAWGTTSLGDFVVAMSDKGLAALEFSSYRPMTEEALRARFPAADVIDSQNRLTDVLAQVKRAIEEPEFDPAIPLDLRGTSYEVEVWSMLRALPSGETTSYGALAARLGTRDAREVTEAIARNPIAVLVPCHRVVKKDGSISGYRWGVKRKRELLAREQRADGFRLV